MKNNKLLLASASVLLALGLASCGKTKTVDPKDYTYRGYSSALATNWNPHAWETSADDSVLGYLSEGLVSLTAKDTKNGVYQWAYDMATSVTDVTKDHPEDLVKYCGATVDEAAAYVAGITESNPGQFVYEIKLRDGLKWQDGTKIDANTYVNSMKLLLDPAMKNYRANLYVAGESAVAGGYGYYYSGAEGYFGAETVYDTWAAADPAKTIFCLSNKLTQGKLFGSNFIADYMGNYGYSYENILAYFEAYGGPTADENKQLEGKTLATINADASLKAILDADFEFWCTEENEELTFFVAENKLPEKTADTVGCYKVDDSTFRYVMANPLDMSQTLVSFSGASWIVHEETYNKLKNTSGALVTTTYNTSVDTSCSYGPYKLTSLQDEKQMIFERNENWWGYEKDADGKLVSYTQFEVDGAKQKQYQATKIVIDVLDDAAAKQKFLAGELTEYSPTSSELKDYTLSDALYQVDETYTMSFFFNTDVDVLQALDKDGTNTNGVVLSSKNFRKGLSLAINRAEFVTATPAYKAAYSLMNDLYYYDVWNDPSSQYRNSDPAMEAVCKLYGVTWGEGTPYATLKDAYKSINGYNLTEAKALMKAACDELSDAGLYTKGADVKIKIAYAKGAIQSDELAQIALLNKFVAAAVEGSGFGKVEFEAVGNLADRYGDVPAGKYAVGYGAWGGAAFYPFRNLQVYADPDQYDVNELGCWDPTTESCTVEFDIGGEHFSDTMTWQAWSNALIGSGKYANASNEFKLKVTAFLEEAYLEMFYRIPLCGTTAAFLLGYQVSYFTETYNIMYDFGGMRLMKFNYTDMEWAQYVKDHGGVIDYK